MYCRLQGYLSPPLVVLIRYHQVELDAMGLVPVLGVAQGGLCWWRESVMLPLSSGIDPLKDIRIRVETYDGCCTIWYERSKLKNPTEVICNRVTNQLMGLNIKEVNVSVI